MFWRASRRKGSFERRDRFRAPRAARPDGRGDRRARRGRRSPADHCHRDAGDPRRLRRGLPAAGLEHRARAGCARSGAQSRRAPRLRRADRLRARLADPHLPRPGGGRHQVLDEPAPARAARGGDRRSRDTPGAHRRDRRAHPARARRAADVFGLRDQQVAFLSHCGSRGLGHNLATGQFRDLREHFARHGIPLPAGDRDLVYAPLGTPEADAYLDAMALGANFATLNHLLINALVLEAFQEIVPGVRGTLVYFISHNIARPEDVGGEAMWVHRKGATRAFPAGHAALAGTPFADVGHPILLPGNPRDGSVVMVADAGAAAACYSVNHGAGRALGRKAAMRTLDQDAVERSLAERDILSNCRAYPRDEAPAAYKNFEDVLDSVKGAGLASEVARLDARFVIKDGAPADD